MPKYKEMMKDILSQESRILFRLRMIQTARRESISAAAREFGTTNKTVRYWLNRYRAEGESGLRNQTRKTQVHPDQMPLKMEVRVQEFRQKHPQLGARRIKEILEIPFSAKTVNKKLKQAGLVHRKTKRYERRKDMSEIRRNYPILKKLQTDIKYLTDIPEIALSLRMNRLPLYEITARDYKTGYLFLGFSHEKTSVATGIFADYLCEGLKKLGIDPENLVFQTDNGNEFARMGKKPTYFEEIVTSKHHSQHDCIPYRRPTWNSDVESLHRLIEDEFWRMESFDSKQDFLAKVYTYQLFFNLVRKNRNRDNKTPRELLLEENPYLDPVKLVFPPIIVDDYIYQAEMIKSTRYFNGSPPTNRRNIH